jgi:FkbM family methyltransferase
MSAPPFGALAPSPSKARLRALAHRLPTNYFGRKAASLLLGPAGGRAARAYDVTVFASQKARLHPHDNICEKRVYLTPQLWDREERAALGAAIAGHSGRSFHFIDAGANVGLYTLFARSAALLAGANLRAACVEADPEMRARLAFNLAASDAGAEVQVFPCALAEAEGTLRFSVNRGSRGESRLDAEGDISVPARPLAAIVAQSGFARIDAMKMDIEGAELATLRAFFAAAPKTLWPRLIVLETSHETESSAASALCAGAGYATRLRTRMNAVLALQ